MKFYETTIVIDSLQKPDDIQGTITKVKTFIANNGGEIVSIDEWGKKRLAYEIKRRQYGTYFQIYFKAPGTLPKLLERELLLEESVLRYLLLAFDQKLFEEKVAANEEKAAPKPVETVEKEPAVTEAATEEKKSIEEEKTEETTEAE